ncbi:hypothetical protein SDC9_93073 [bioreactor metagenome]|uniref:Uncharacterized protein n=1 Tax=bioreactor metagenome TaxID=1076179 RepID=A0A645A9G0_9ZZZZ
MIDKRLCQADQLLRSLLQRLKIMQNNVFRIQLTADGLKDFFSRTLTPGSRFCAFQFDIHLNILLII